SLAYPRKLGSVALGDKVSGHPAVRAKPCREARLQGHNSPSRALGLCCLHFDMPARKIDFAPIQALNLRVTESSKRADRNHRNHIRSNTVCGFSQRPEF